MGSIADTYAKKEVMSHRMWNACIKLDMIEWKELNLSLIHISEPTRPY